MSPLPQNSGPEKGGQHPLQTNQASPGVSDFADGSGHIFSLYLEMATEEDEKMVEDWKADAKGILIFTGLFSAAVSVLISVSIQDIRLNAQDTSNVYLANIDKMLANPNGLHEPASLPHFSPPNHAVWVNALWFLSLVISLICALLATLLQQWARRYLKITRLRSSLHKRARIRAFFAEGVKNCLLPRVVDVLPTLLHISLFLFFAGLIIFLGNVDLTIFILVLSWVGFCAAVYWCITCMPIFRHDSPYYTPLSLLTWHIVTRALFFIYRFLRWCTWPVRSCYGAYSHFSLLEESCRKSLEWGMQKTAEETALNLPPGIDTRAFMWTFDCLDEDDGLERFFSGLPGFRSSRFVKDPLPSLTEEEKWRLSEGLRGLLDRTFSSDILQADVKDQRALICTKAIDQEHMLNAFILHAILFKYKHSGPVATEVARILRGRDYIHARDILYALSPIYEIITTRQPSHDSWYIFASNLLGFPEPSLREYATHTVNLEFAILIHVIRYQVFHIRTLSQLPLSNFSFLLNHLAKGSNFNVNVASTELRHEFCALWNQIVEVRDGLQEDPSRVAGLILKEIRNVYLALHPEVPDAHSAPTQPASPGSQEPSSYPKCKDSNHRSVSTPHIHNLSDFPPIESSSQTLAPAASGSRDPNAEGEEGALSGKGKGRGRT